MDIFYFDKIIIDINQVPVEMLKIPDKDDQKTVPIFEAHAQRLVFCK